jgi:(S)-mandelate dehydrogenase
MALSRKLYGGKDFRRALSIAELRAVARRRVPHFAFEYVECGAEDEVTSRWNRAVFERFRFVPRALENTTARHPRTTLFGREAGAPLVVAPTAMNGMLARRGDVALARAAAAAGIPFCLSTFSNVRLEALAAEVGGRHWMQLYLLGDRAIARDIIARADQAGYEALVLTIDANVFGFREWDRRNYLAPGRLTLRNLADHLEADIAAMFPVERALATVPLAARVRDGIAARTEHREVSQEAALEARLGDDGQQRRTCVP